MSKNGKKLMKTDDEMKGFLADQGYFGVRKVGDKWIGCTRMLYTTALCIGLDDTGYAIRYDYEDPGAALLAALNLIDIDNPLPGWVKSYGTRESKISGDREAAPDGYPVEGVFNGK